MEILVENVDRDGSKPRRLVARPMNDHRIELTSPPRARSASKSALARTPKAEDFGITEQSLGDRQRWRFIGSLTRSLAASPLTTTSLDESCGKTPPRRIHRAVSPASKLVFRPRRVLRKEAPMPSVKRESLPRWQNPGRSSTASRHSSHPEPTQRSHRLSTCPSPHPEQSKDFIALNISKVTQNSEKSASTLLNSRSARRDSAWRLVGARSLGDLDTDCEKETIRYVSSAGDLHSVSCREVLSPLSLSTASASPIFSPRCIPSPARTRTACSPIKYSPMTFIRGYKKDQAKENQDQAKGNQDPAKGYQDAAKGNQDAIEGYRDPAVDGYQDPAIEGFVPYQWDAPPSVASSETQNRDDARVDVHAGKSINVFESDGDLSPAKYSEIPNPAGGEYSEIQLDLSFDTAFEGQPKRRSSTIFASPERRASASPGETMSSPLERQEFQLTPSIRLEYGQEADFWTTPRRLGQGTEFQASPSLRLDGRETDFQATSSLRLDGGETEFQATPSLRLDGGETDFQATPSVRLDGEETDVQATPSLRLDGGETDFQATPSLRLDGGETDFQTTYRRLACRYAPDSRSRNAEHSLGQILGAPPSLRLECGAFTDSRVASLKSGCRQETDCRAPSLRPACGQGSEYRAPSLKSLGQETDSRAPSLKSLGQETDYQASSLKPACKQEPESRPSSLRPTCGQESDSRPSSLRPCALNTDYRASSLRPPQTYPLVPEFGPRPHEQIGACGTASDLPWVLERHVSESSLHEALATLKLALGIGRPTVCESHAVFVLCEAGYAISSAHYHVLSLLYLNHIILKDLPVR